MTQNGIFVKMTKCSFSTKVFHKSRKMWEQMWKTLWRLWKTLQNRELCKKSNARSCGKLLPINYKIGFFYVFDLPEKS